MLWSSLNLSSAKDSNELSFLKKKNNNEKQIPNLFPYLEYCRYIIQNAFFLIKVIK